jgi:hypothetical protein
MVFCRWQDSNIFVSGNKSFGGRIMNTHVKFLAVVTVAVFLGSCASMSAVQNPGFDTSVYSKNGDGIAKIDVDVMWQTGGVSGGLYHGIEGFSISVVNKTDDIISLVWSKSSLSYNGKSYLPFIEGQKYSESSTPQNPTVIPANGQTNVNVFSSGQPYYATGQYGGWRMSPIDAKEVVIVLSVESQGANYPFEISAKQKNQGENAELEAAE